jgi:tRNA pseudouridine32 synthase/23S rRNA pseudouridine746 synthase
LKNKLILKKTYPAAPSEPQKIVDYLCTQVPLSKSIIKKVMNCGGCWLRTTTGRRQQKLVRIRRSTKPLRPGDYLEFYYHADIIKLAVPEEEIVPLWESADYGIWFKPSGILAQGTIYGDHLSLLRIVEKQLFWCIASTGKFVVQWC